MKKKDFFEHGPARQAREKILAFCKTEARRQGGILLVSGHRGVGKTRLVDYALNRHLNLNQPIGYKLVDRIKKALCRWISCLQPLLPDSCLQALQKHIKKLLCSKRLYWIEKQCGLLFGDDHDRSRQKCKRSPRQVERLLLPVDVSPFISYEISEDELNRCSGDSSNLLSNKKTTGLLQNIVFGLTSAIDHRYAVHRHGRTLRNRLGFWRFWFSPTALYWPQAEISAKNAFAFSGGLSLAFALPALLVWGLLPEWLNIANSGSWPGGWSGSIALLLSPSFLTCFILACTIGWLGLRYRDHRGLQRMSRRLYELVHAQETERTLRDELTQKWQWESRLHAPLRLLAVMLVAGGAAGAVATMETPASMPFWGALAVAAIGLLTFGISRSQSDDMNSSFGSQNHNWMITMLRRYLFMMHRAGLEPILVVDELDKLDDERSAHSAAEHQEMDSFLHALKQLKQTLGAEFLWILITNCNLHRNIVFQDHLGNSNYTLEIGSLSPLVGEAIFIEPISYQDCKQYIQQIAEEDKLKCNHLQQLIDILLPDFWLTNRGIFAKITNSLAALRAEMEGHSATATAGEHHKVAEYLVNCIEELKKERYAVFTQYAVRGRAAQMEMQRILQTPWIRARLFSALVDFAYHLYHPLAMPVTYRAAHDTIFLGFRFDPIDTPESIDRLAQMVFLLYLQRAGAAYPVPRHPPAWNWDERIRLI